MTPVETTSMLYLIKVKSCAKVFFDNSITAVAGGYYMQSNVGISCT